MLDELVGLAANWITAQRNNHRPSADRLAPEIGAMFIPFFGDEIIGVARVRIVPSLENPAFFPAFETRYQVALPDFSSMDGITLDDTILLRDHRIELPLIFHELVHVAQYQTLGILEFARQYVMGWAENGREYRAIPLERDAYELENRFRAEPARRFSVLDEVRCQLGR